MEDDGGVGARSHRQSGARIQDAGEDEYGEAQGVRQAKAAIGAALFAGSNGGGTCRAALCFCHARSLPAEGSREAHGCLVNIPGPDASYSEIKAWQESLKAPARPKVKEKPEEKREKLKTPFPYFGGKSRAADLVWSRFGQVVNYVEPFFGSGAVLLACPEELRPRVETVNDANALLCNFWRAVRADSEAVAEVADYPVIETDLHSRHRWLLGQVAGLRAKLDADPDHFDPKAAGWWVWGASAWIGSGWCDEDRAKPSKQLPRFDGNGGTEARGDGKPGGGAGVHEFGMRVPSQRLPDLSGGTQWGTDEPNARAGRGVHSATVREPSRQLPDIGGKSKNGKPMANVGCGTHSKESRTRLYDIFAALSARLRYTRVACGDWSRICTPAVTYRHGLTAVFLDPPYDGYEHVYGSSSGKLSTDVRSWALDMGQREDMRIALCGYEGEHDMPPSWECVAWKANGGYGNQGQGQGRENARRERIWFSPACLRVEGT
ncbi:MAG: DNA adenine methylase [Acidimicrobiia bacterium]|nr:MAG: DNA adenine methylase [Acidimicrobiia bacterium]